MVLPVRKPVTQTPRPAMAPVQRMRPRRARSLLRAIALAFALFVLAAIVFAVWFVRRSWPETSGTLKVAGLQSPVEILRDRWGLPHIYAQNNHDLFFAEGYAQAQDRLWQMEFTRQTANGALSSMLGSPTLPIDKTVRTIGLARIAERDWASIQGEEREEIQAFSDGINAYIESHRGRLAVEFRLLGVTPKPWKPQDTLATIGIISWILAENGGFEVSRANFIAKAGEANARQLLPPYDEGAPFIIPAEADGYSSMRSVPSEHSPLMDALLGTPGPNVGSNSWVVQGNRTTSGVPLLANDTHLGLFMPSSWYAIGLHFGDVDAVGYSFVGAPGIVIGHNQHIAWGITDLVGDVQDFYIEKFDNAEHPQRYEFQGQWRDVNTLTETIEVKGQKPFMLEVRSTHHGPIVSNLGGRFKYPQPLALAWTGTKCQTAVGAVLAMNRAKNWNEFRAALSLWDGPDMNFLYADREGNIGYQATGRIPIRSAHHQGAVPVPGWTGEYEWKGFIPAAELPHELNPSDGMIVAANQKAVSDRYPYHLGYEFADPFRAIRIRQLLSANAHLSAGDMKNIQADNYELPAKELIPYLETVKPANDAETKALADLRSWDLHCSVNQTAPAIFQTWYRFLVKDTVGDELGAKLTDTYMEYYWVHMPVMIQLLKQPNHPLFDDIRTPQVESRDDIVRRSFHDAVEWLSKHYGSEPKNWTWGKMHTLTFSHRPLGLAEIPVVSRMFNAGPLPLPACDRFTVNSAWFSLDDPEHPFVSDGGPSQRIIMDLSSWDNTLAVNSTGESEHLFHPHRDDELTLWKDNQYHPMLFTRKTVESDVAERLKLLPAENKEVQAALSGSGTGGQR